jgi:hypothetical protein
MPAALDRSVRHDREPAHLLPPSGTLRPDDIIASCRGVPEVAGWCFMQETDERDGRTGARGLFVSHAGNDQQFAHELVEFMIAGGLDSDLIKYTSRPDLGIPGGQIFPSWIREELRNSSLVLSILSAEYFTRRWCVMELGAAFVMPDGILFPLILPSVPLGAGQLPGGLQVYELSDGHIRGTLWALHNRLQDRVQTHLPSDRWNHAIESRLPSLEEALSRHPKAAVIGALSDDPIAILNIDLRRGFEHWDATGRTHHHIAPQDLRRRAVFAARSGWEPDSDTLEFLIFSSSYDGEMLPAFAVVARAFGQPIGVATAKTWFRATGLIRPRYRLAMAAAHFDDTHRTMMVGQVLAIPGLSDVRRNLAESILDRNVQQFIEDPQKSIDLDDSKRRDLLEHWHEPQL